MYGHANDIYVFFIIKQIIKILIKTRGNEVGMKPKQIETSSTWSHLQPLSTATGPLNLDQCSTVAISCDNINIGQSTLGVDHNVYIYRDGQRIHI